MNVDDNFVAGWESNIITSEQKQKKKTGQELQSKCPMTSEKVECTIWVLRILNGIKWLFWMVLNSLCAPSDAPQNVSKANSCRQNETKMHFIARFQHILHHLSTKCSKQLRKCNRIESNVATAKQKCWVKHLHD